MNILHIINDFEGSKVHKNLIKELDKIGVRQLIYVPTSFLNRNKPHSKIDFKTKESKIIYSKVLNKWHKYFFDNKIKFLCNDIESLQLNLKDIDIIHASTWCSDGSIAYYLSNKYAIPYIISIRDTDINLHFKYLIWKKAFFKSIINKSSHIIFISEVYKVKLLNSLNKEFSSDIALKSLIIHNGIDDIYIKSSVKNFSSNIKGKILHLGAIVPRKNVLKLYKAVNYLNRTQDLKLNLDAIGAGMPNRDDTKYLNKLKRLKNYNGWFNIKQNINSYQLIEKFKYYDMLVVPSYRETFGLVYLEALSQGIPVIFTKDEGFDGVFKNELIGYSVNPKSFRDIADKIEKIYHNYDQLKFNISNIDFTPFLWENVAKKYFLIYKKTIK